MNLFRCRSVFRIILLIRALMSEYQHAQPGGVVERLMAPVLKTGRAKALVGSNPTPSASPF
jgi:hypothetical protein